jgi:hypothetical protein
MEKKRSRRNLIRCFRIDHVICMTPKIVYVHSVLRLLSYSPSPPSVGAGVRVTACGRFARPEREVGQWPARRGPPFIKLPENSRRFTMVPHHSPLRGLRAHPSISRLRIIASRPSSPDPRPTHIPSGKAPFGTPAREIEYCRDSLGRPSMIVQPPPEPVQSLPQGSQESKRRFGEWQPAC